MKKIAILYSTYTPTIDAIISKLEYAEVACFDTLPENLSEYDLVVNINFASEINQNHISVHYSLLPAFDSDEPLRDAILAGVKVTGLTFYYTSPRKIIAQYPIFISNASHYDDVERELEYLEQVLYPLILDKILRNEPFELKNLLSKGCSGSCGGGCLGCSH